MFNLRLLGGVGLSDPAGKDVEALLRQRKHMAILAYLALPNPGTWHSRDSVVGTFWPEHDQSRARTALNSALYQIRRHFPDETVKSRGDDDLSISPAILTTDVNAMVIAANAGRFAEALDLYKGDLLPGVFISDSPTFDSWLMGERTRLVIIARKAAAQLSDFREKSGDLVGAVDAARRGAQLDPDDEAAARRWIALLDRSGDRAQAFAVYERFRNHMSEEFGSRPSTETLALLEAIRSRRECSTSLTVPVTQPTGSTRATNKKEESDSLPLVPSSAARNSVRRFRITWPWLLAPAAISGLLWILYRPDEVAAARRSPRSLFVLPMENQTGDPSLDYVASGIGEGVTERLERLGGLTIRSGARSSWPTTTRHDIQTIGRQLGFRILLRGSVHKSGNSLEVRASVLDAETLTERRVADRRFTISEVRDVGSKVAADVAGAVFRVPMPLVSTDHSVDPESYRLTLEGWHTLIGNVRTLSPPAPLTGERRTLAAKLFTRAVEIDPQNARAWSGLSSIYGGLAVTDQVSFSEGYERSTVAAERALAIDSLQGSAWADLAIMRALKYRSLTAGLALIRKAELVDPSNPEIFLIKSTLLRSAHLFDQARDAARVARQLDPFNSYYVDSEASGEICAGRPAVALRIYQKELELNPSAPLMQTGITRALALMGRYDEALFSWRKDAATKGDTVTGKILADAKGKDGYLKAYHNEGHRRLATLKLSKGRISPLRIVQATFQSGDANTAYAYIDQPAVREIPAFYRLPCMPAVDEFRNTPELAAAANKIGNLRTR